MLKTNAWITTVMVLLCAGIAVAKVDSEKAAQLKTTLTPFGSERAGNADGTIPEWTGGLTPDKAPASWKAPNGHRPDPFAADEALFTITVKNMAEYADKLTEGQKALLKTYPESFKLPIYPSRRSHALPEWVNEKTFKNATTVELIDDGTGISDNAQGGTPFPLPQNGLEVIWNHVVRFQGIYRTVSLAAYEVQPSGKYSLEQRATMDLLYHYYMKDGAKDRLFNLAWTITAPARFAGDGILALDSINAAKTPRKAWIYSAGERRVRRAPTLNFDSPDYTTTTYDDYELFNGSPERYDWKLVGKKEMYIPYNNYRVDLPDLKYDDIHTVNHPNPEYLRYELHRVWVVEATLKKGSRHIYAKRTFYIDEDSWNVVATDKYDGNGDLWRVSLSYLQNFYDVPMTSYAFYNHFDLKNGVYLTYGLTNEEKAAWDFSKTPPAESFFTPQALRRRGR